MSGPTQDLTPRPLAVVTGASSGIGLELARELAERSYDLVVCAEDAAIALAADALSAAGGAVVGVDADLATEQGVCRLVDAVRQTGRPVDALVLNAGVGLAGAFLDSDLDEQVRLLRLDVEALVRLTHALAPAMTARGAGRVMITSSVAATMPGPWYATYAAAKSFAQSFALGLRRELADTGVTVTALQPGPTDTEFLDRAGLQDSVVAKGHLADPAVVAAKGVEAMLDGAAEQLVGVTARAQAALGRVLPHSASAAVHGAMTKPRGSQAAKDEGT